MRYYELNKSQQTKESTEIHSSLFFHNKIHNQIVLPDISDAYVKELLKLPGYANYATDLSNILVEYEQLKIINKAIENGNVMKSDLKEYSKNRFNLRCSIYKKFLSIPNCVNPDNMEALQEIWRDVIPVKSNFNAGNSILLKSADLKRDDVERNVYGCQMRFQSGHLSRWRYMAQENTLDWWMTRGYMAVSLSDICRTPTVEACDPGFASSAIGLANSRLIQPGQKCEEVINPQSVHFLKGSASLEAFCAYLMRTRTTKKSLPMRLACLGNRYLTAERGHVGQDRGVSVLLASANPDELQTQLHDLLAAVSDFWQHSASVPLTASCSHSRHHQDKLRHWEGARFSLSCGVTELVKVSWVGDFLSRRLCIRDFDNVPLHLVYAEVLSIESILTTLKNDQECIFYKPSTNGFREIFTDKS